MYSRRVLLGTLGMRTRPLLLRIQIMEGFTLPHEYHWTPCTLSTLYWEFSGTAQGLSVHFQEMRLVPESPCTLYMDFAWTVQGLYQPNH